MLGYLKVTDIINAAEITSRNPSTQEVAWMLLDTVNSITVRIETRSKVGQKS